jgi:hypothetical protein
MHRRTVLGWYHKIQSFWFRQSDGYQSPVFSVAVCASHDLDAPWVLQRVTQSKGPNYEESLDRSTPSLSDNGVTPYSEREERRPELSRPGRVTSASRATDLQSATRQHRPELAANRRQDSPVRASAACQRQPPEPRLRWITSGVGSRCRGSGVPAARTDGARWLEDVAELARVGDHTPFGKAAGPPPVPWIRCARLALVGGMVGLLS